MMMIMISRRHSNNDVSILLVLLLLLSAMSTIFTIKAQQVVEQERPAIIGSSYCTYSPDTSCYVTGWPDCCGKGNTVCPETKQGCDYRIDNNNNNNYGDDDDIIIDGSSSLVFIGSSVCTYSPNYECYSFGWPECCDDDDQSESDENNNTTDENVSSSSSSCPNNEIPECDKLLTWSSSSSRAAIDIKNVESIVFVIVVTGVIVNFIAN